MYISIIFAFDNRPNTTIISVSVTFRQKQYMLTPFYGMVPDIVGSNIFLFKQCTA